MGSQQSHSSSEGLSLLDIGPRGPVVIVAYPGRRSSEETDSVFDEIDSYPEGGTYILNAIAQAGGGAYPVEFIKGSEREGLEVTASSFRVKFAASTIMSSLMMRALLNQLEKYGVPSAYAPTLLGEHFQANNPPEGYFAFSHHIIRAGAQLPLWSYFIDVLEYFEITPLQFALNGYSILAALFIIYHQMGFPQPTPVDVNYMYTFKKIPSEGAGFYYLSSWLSGKLNLIENYPSNAGH